MTGIRTTNLAAASALDEFLGHREIAPGVKEVVRAPASDVLGPLEALMEQAIAGGIDPQGTYSGATTYSLRQVVIDQGASWIYINNTPGSGNAPPTLPTTSNSYWRALALPGANGLAGVSGADPSRPGEAALAFCEASSISAAGAPGDATEIDAGRITTADYGEVVRLDGVSLAIGSRFPMRYEQGRTYRVRFKVRRVSDPADPATSTVSIGVRWLDKDYVELSPGFSATTYTDLTEAVGPREVVRIIGLDLIPPEGTIYFRPYIVASGTDHTTDVEIIEQTDITNSLGIVERIITPTHGRISVCGDSLGGVYYTLPGKAWINRLSALTDWQFQNFSLTSDDTLEAWARFIAGTTIYSGTYSLRDHEAHYVLIPLYSNDSNVRLSRTRLFIENFRRLIKGIRSAGAIPIIVTSGRKLYGIEQAAMSRLAREEGALYWEITGEYFLQDVTRDADYHSSNHPGVRHTHHYSDALLRRLWELGRPQSSFKAFRPRYHRQLFAPVMSWTFNGGTTAAYPDASNDGTLNGGAAIVTDDERGEVYEGYANGDYMTFGGSHAMPASYTMACWVKPDSLGASRNILSGGTANQLVIMLNTANLWIRHGGGSADIDVASGIAADGKWNHVAVTYDATRDLLSAYVNGALLHSMTGAGAHNCSSPRLGASGTTNSFIGRMDDLHIWDKPLQAWQIALVAQHRDGLGFDNAEQRFAAWKEVEVGHYALEEAQWPYYDELQSITPSFAGQNNEYLTLQGGGELTFVDKAMLQFVLPGHAVNTYGLRLRMKGADDATLYYLSRRPLTPSGGNAGNKNRGFIVASYPAGVATSDEYTYDGHTYTIHSVTPNKDGAGYVIWAFSEVSTTDVSGTLTRVSGSGPATINFTATMNFTDGAFYDAVDKPYMRWLADTSITAELRNGQAAIRATNVLRQIIDYDVVTVLVEKTGEFTLSDIELRWFGIPGKDTRERPRALYAGGTELLTDTTFDGLSLSAWTAIGSAAEDDPDDGVLPYDVTKVVNVNKADKVRQAVTITADATMAKRIQVRVNCRYAPPKFTPSSGSPTDLEEFHEIAPVTLHTPDAARLVISLDNGNEKYAVVAKEMVGLAPVDVVVDIDIPNARVWETSSCRLTLSAEGLFGEDATVQLYRANVIDCGVVN